MPARSLSRRQLVKCLRTQNIPTPQVSCSVSFFAVGSGRTLGIVGESGYGKTTIARLVVGLTPRLRGEIQLHGEGLAPQVEGRTHEQRAVLRLVFQNPTMSLNPKLPAHHTIVRSLHRLAQLNRKDSRERTVKLARAVKLETAYLDRRPDELSSGEQ